MYSTKLSGTWIDIQKFLDCTKITNYALVREGNKYDLYIKDTPPFITLYEKILHIQFGRFTELGE
jgi:hypothetical protein